MAKSKKEKKQKMSREEMTDLQKAVAEKDQRGGKKKKKGKKKKGKKKKSKKESSGPQKASTMPKRSDKAAKKAAKKIAKQLAKNVAKAVKAAEAKTTDVEEVNVAVIPEGSPEDQQAVDFVDTAIAALGLKGRLTTALRNSNMKTFQDVLDYLDEGKKLKDLPGFGPTTIEAVEELLIAEGVAPESMRKGSVTEGEVCEELSKELKEDRAKPKTLKFEQILEKVESGESTPKEVFTDILNRLIGIGL